MTQRTTKATAIAAALAVVANFALHNNVSKLSYAEELASVDVVRVQEANVADATNGEVRGYVWGTYDMTHTETMVDANVPAAAQPLLVEEPVKEQWYSDEYLANNLAIKEYADKYATFTFEGTVFDGLAVMAQANTESAYMCDTTQTLTALYPSVFVPFNEIGDIEALNCAKVWGNPKNLNGASLKVNRFYTANGLVAWSTGDGVNEQGPLQTRVSPYTAQLLKESGCESEYSKLKATGALSSMMNTLYGFEASVYATGSDNYNYMMGYETTGDRWAIKDNCLIYKTDKKRQLEKLWDIYYKDCGYTPNKYEYLAILAYSHWIPYVINGELSEATARYYGFSRDNAWFELSHQLSSEEAIAIIRQHVYDDIDENRELFYSGEYTKEEAMAMFNPIINHGSTTYANKSVPWQIFNELADAGLVDPSLVIVDPAYGYQHAMKYAICYLYAYEMLDILLMEEY